MKCLRVAERLAGQRLAASAARPCCLGVQQKRQQVIARGLSSSSRKSLSSSSAPAAAEEVIYEDENSQIQDHDHDHDHAAAAFPSPPPEAAHSSAKLAALHARLKLPSKVPLETLARTLVDSSADSSRDFSNASLSQVGSSLLSYHVSEWLLCTYPRLPMAVLFSAMNAYIGPATLTRIAHEWGVETAAAPGAEVDPGLLQFSRLAPGSPLPASGSALRPNSQWNYRRGLTSRVVYDDEFGDTQTHGAAAADVQSSEAAHAHFVRALVGALYLHAGRAEAKAFIRAHLLSRHLPIDKLFVFETAARDLSRLCAREDFDFPVARLLSETGRHSRHPVYVVGIYSGKDKLGEAAGPSLNEARTRAAIAALKSWYMYSPVPGRGTDIRVPSDTEQGGKWDGVHIDMGEIVAC